MSNDNKDASYWDECFVIVRKVGGLKTGGKRILLAFPHVLVNDTTAERGKLEVNMFHVFSRHTHKP